MEIGVVILFVVVGGASVLIFGTRHERLAHVLAWIMGRDLPVLDAEIATQTIWHPYYWRVLAWLFVPSAALGSVLVLASPPSLACKNVEPGAMRCTVTRHTFGIAQHGAVDDVLPTITRLRANPANSDRMELADANRVQIVVDSDDAKIARVQHVQLNDAFTGKRATSLNLENDAPIHFFAGAPLMLLGLLVPHCLASFALARRGERRKRSVDSAAVVAGTPKSPPPAPVLGACPRCTRALAKGRGLLLEDVCEQCRGRLLPRDAATRVLVDELGLSLDVLRDLAAHFAGARLGCPSCGAKMSPVTLKGTASDLCLACGALWLDVGELERLTAGRWKEVGAVDVDPVSPVHSGDTPGPTG